MLIVLILGPLLFSIDICDLFWWDYKCDIANYADDDIVYFWRKLKPGLRKLENSTRDLCRWFKENQMKANPDKCHLFETTNSLTSVNINDFQITYSIEETLLGKLSFENHVSSVF